MSKKYSKEQKNLFAYYESDVPQFKLKEIFVRKCVLTVTKTEKTKGGHYYIHVKGHPVDKTFYFRSDAEPWNVHTTTPCGSTDHKRITCTVRETTARRLLPQSMLNYLNIFFKFCDIDHEGTCLNPPQRCTEMKLGSDSYDMNSYACVHNGTEEPGLLYFGPRTLFQHTQFCKDHDISMFINIPDMQEDGICKDESIRNYPSPDKGAEKVYNDLRGLCRYLYPSLKYIIWKTMKELVQLNIKGLLKALSSDVKRLSAMNIAVGCHTGRTRSATVCMFIKLQLHVAHILVGFLDVIKSVKSTEELQRMEVDNNCSDLATIREDMNAALSRRWGKGNEKAKADRKER